MGISILVSSTGDNLKALMMMMKSDSGVVVMVFTQVEFAEGKRIFIEEDWFASSQTGGGIGRRIRGNRIRG